MSMAISLIRIIAGPVLLFLIMTNSASFLLVSLGIMTAATLLGLLNTFVLLNGKENAEHIVHTVSDSIYHISVFLAFLANHWMPIWMLLMIYSRDIIIPYVKSFALQSGIQVPDELASTKFKNAVHGISQIAVVAAITGLVPSQPAPGINTVFILLCAATAMSAISFVNYLIMVKYSGRGQTGS